LHSAGGKPVDRISAARQRMRPTISIAAVICSAGSAISARSARECARSDSVPVIAMSSQVSWPA
jgi:hypothetical protein